MMALVIELGPPVQEIASLLVEPANEKAYSTCTSVVTRS
jgi:hypothetical protein